MFTKLEETIQDNYKLRLLVVLPVGIRVEFPF